MYFKLSNDICSHHAAASFNNLLPLLQAHTTNTINTTNTTTYYHLFSFFAFNKDQLACLSDPATQRKIELLLQLRDPGTWSTGSFPG